MTREQRLAGQEHTGWTEDDREIWLESGSSDYRSDHTHTDLTGRYEEGL